MKTCTKCNETKDRSEFHTQGRCKDGLYPSCKACRASARLTPEYRELERARQERLMASPERLEARKWYAKAYRGSESGKATRDSYRVGHAGTDSCKVSRAKASAKYAKTEQGNAINSEAKKKFVATDAGKALSRKHCGRRRARKLDSLCTCCDPDERDQIYAMLWKDEDCYICSAKAEATDHVIPLNGDGLHCIQNFKAICTACNSSKGHYIWPGQPGWEELVKRAIGSF